MATEMFPLIPTSFTLPQWYTGLHTEEPPGLAILKQVRLGTHLGSVIMWPLIAFPAASVDPRQTWQTELPLIDLQRLVLHHAPSVCPPPLHNNIPEQRSWAKQNKRHIQFIWLTMNCYFLKWQHSIYTLQESNSVKRYQIMRARLEDVGGLPTEWSAIGPILEGFCTWPSTFNTSLLISSMSHTKGIGSSTQHHLITRVTLPRFKRTSDASDAIHTMQLYL